MQIRVSYRIETGLIMQMLGLFINLLKLHVIIELVT
jgi:hypothetical protein